MATTELIEFLDMEFGRELIIAKCIDIITEEASLDDMGDAKYNPVREELAEKLMTELVHMNSKNTINNSQSA